MTCQIHSLPMSRRITHLFYPLVIVRLARSLSRFVPVMSRIESRHHHRSPDYPHFASQSLVLYLRLALLPLAPRRRDRIARLSGTIGFANRVLPSLPNLRGNACQTSLRHASNSTHDSENCILIVNDTRYALPLSRAIYS